MLNLKGMRFPIDVILVRIRSYVAYPLSYRLFVCSKNSYIEPTASPSDNSDVKAARPGDADQNECP